MRKLLFALPLLALFACSQKQEEVNTSILAGKIENSVTEFVTLTHNDVVDTAQVDSNGVFQLTFTIEEEAYASFLHGRESANIFVTPGDSTYLTLNPKEFDETLVYSGDGAAINNFLVQTLLLQEQILPNSRAYFALDKEAFLAKNDSIQTVLRANLDEFIKSNPDINQYFIKIEQNKLIYKYALEKLNYPLYHKNITRNEAEGIDSTYFNFIADLDCNDGSLLEISSYKYYISTYFGRELEKDTTITKADIILTRR